MKSIKEKAEAYDKVLEWATEAHKVCDGMLKEDLEHLFPELKESEDERMIQYFKDLAQFDKADELYEKYGFSHKDAIAWLEKQGEHSNFLSKIQVGDKVTRNEDGVLVNLSQLNRVAKKDEKQGEKGINGNEREFPISEPPLTLKHAKEVMGIKQDDAWSEEDELMLMSIIQTLKLTNGAAQMKIDWLKSLRPQNRWKPSDEQMNALRYVTNFDYGGHKATLVSLYEQLKKLK